MTQESNHRSPTSKRTTRPVRNRPTLVTSSTPTDSVIVDSPEQVSSEGDTSAMSTRELKDALQAPLRPLQETIETSRTRKLAGFFSRVGKSTQTEMPEADTAQARLARAIRGKTAAPVVKTSVSNKNSEASEPVKASPPTSARSAPARPRSAFKMRYIWGMAIYLLGAQLIGAYEANILHAYHLDNPLFKIGPVAISTSTLVFLATLVILLVLLARFDLIPRNLGAMMGQSTASRRTSPTQSQGTQESVKTQPPTMKQGVKGVDDDLYQEYQEQRRYQQRRDRKR